MKLIFKKRYKIIRIIKPKNINFTKFIKVKI